MTYETLIIEVLGNKKSLQVGLIQLNRPKQLNALSDSLIDELGHILEKWDSDESIGCMVITGNEKAFAAGVDISDMASLSYMDAIKKNLITRNWDPIKQIRKPMIAAVSGFALGGGCELVMMCDIIIAAEGAKFGQPEIKLGIIPGAGGTQRLPRATSKAKAMDLILTGRIMDAQEAERSGLVSRVVPDLELMPTTMNIAHMLCEMSLPSLLLAKECVNRAFESPLSEGVQYERRIFHSLFSTEDQKEGMQAFLQKRKAKFLHR
jgi:enoyl-CoA hydratase